MNALGSSETEGNHLMYIRQTTLFSFEQIIEFQQETKLELILSQIDVSKLSSVLGKSSHSKGANGYDASRGWKLHIICDSKSELPLDVLVTPASDCPHGMNWCSKSNYGYTLKINCYENPRQYGYPLRSSSEWEKQYNKRTSVERCNSRLKEYLNLNSIRSKGILKAQIIDFNSVISFSLRSLNPPPLAPPHPKMLYF